MGRRGGGAPAPLRPLTNVRLCIRTLETLPNGDSKISSTTLKEPKAVSKVPESGIFVRFKSSFSYVSNLDPYLFEQIRIRTRLSPGSGFTTLRRSKRYERISASAGLRYDGRDLSTISTRGSYGSRKKRSFF